MMKWNLANIGLLSLAITLSPGALAAPILSFDNAEADIQKTYQLGDTVSVDLWISGLAPSAGAALGGFDLETGYNGSITNYQNTAFGTSLNDYDFDFLSADELSPNAVRHAGVSLSFDLSDQLSAFKLFTMEFTATQAGESLLALSSVLLADEFGLELLDAQTYTANITVEGGFVSVPEPGTLALLVAGLAALGWRRSRAGALA